MYNKFTCYGTSADGVPSLSVSKERIWLPRAMSSKMITSLQLTSKCGKELRSAMCGCSSSTKRRYSLPLILFLVTDTQSSSG
ncbi:hypothetical protein R3I93_020492 [Phoxinus phoxinus]|uniref:Uncharacterized protein n=1 Tax=Phoxinus phoxinus TaxID=58324 RepID=A0AAN9GTK9_9TELE